MGANLNRRGAFAGPRLQPRVEKTPAQTRLAGLTAGFRVIGVTCDVARPRVVFVSGLYRPVTSRAELQRSTHSSARVMAGGDHGKPSHRSQSCTECTPSFTEKDAACGVGRCNPMSHLARSADRSSQWNSVCTRCNSVTDDLLALLSVLRSTGLPGWREHEAAPTGPSRLQISRQSIRVHLRPIAFDLSSFCYEPKWQTRLRFC